MLPSKPPLLPLAPRQCLVVANASVLAAAASVWLDGLYLRTHAPASPAGAQGAAVGPLAALRADGGSEDAGLWMTGCTLQGHAEGRDATRGGAGVHVEGRMYAEGATGAPQCC